MDMQKSQPLSLKRRCMGPRAVRIDTLVRRGEAAMEKVVRDYPVYAQGRLDEVRRLAARALADRHDDDAWKGFRNALRDLQTSSAMAGQPWIARFAAALQGELALREATDPHLPVLVDLHLDAIAVAAAESATEGPLAELAEKLNRASQALRH